jgi:hypothetical protein
MMAYFAGLGLPECAREQTGPVRLTNGPALVIRQWPGIVEGAAAYFLICHGGIAANNHGLTVWKFTNITSGNLAGNV